MLRYASGLTAQSRGICTVMYCSGLCGSSSRAPRESAQAQSNMKLTAASADAKRWACKVLSLHASEKSVPAMVKLLGDPASADAARLVLQRMPGGAADQALLDALKTAQGVTAAGIRNWV